LFSSRHTTKVSNTTHDGTAEPAVPPNGSALQPVGLQARVELNRCADRSELFPLKIASVSRSLLEEVRLFQKGKRDDSIST